MTPISAKGMAVARSSQLRQISAEITARLRKGSA